MTKTWILKTRASLMQSRGFQGPVLTNRIYTSDFGNLVLINSIHGSPDLAQEPAGTWEIDHVAPLREYQDAYGEACEKAVTACRQGSRTKKPGSRAG